SAAERELLEVPEVRKDAAAMEPDPVGGGRFEGREPRRRELASQGEGVECPVTGARGNQGANARAAVEGKVERAPCPEERPGFVEERRLHQDEDAERDVVAAEEVSGKGKLLERHFLVEPFERFEVHGFEAHGDLELAGKQVAETRRALIHQRGVTLDDDPLEGTEKAGDGGKGSGRKGARAEEADAG